jgi:hypothetical protein
MRLTTLIVVLTFVMSALTLALAQKGDRLPDDPIEPKMVRTITIGADGQELPFRGRWEPVGALLAVKPSGRPVTTQNVPAASLGAHVPIPRARKLAQDTRPAQVLCTRHGMRTVWQGQSWRCRK